MVREALGGLAEGVGGQAQLGEAAAHPRRGPASCACRGWSLQPQHLLPGALHHRLRHHNPRAGPHAEVRSLLPWPCAAPMPARWKRMLGARGPPCMPHACDLDLLPPRCCAPYIPRCNARPPLLPQGAPHPAGVAARVSLRQPASAPRGGLFPRGSSDRLLLRACGLGGMEWARAGLARQAGAVRTCWHAGSSQSGLPAHPRSPACAGGEHWCWCGVGGEGGRGCCCRGHAWARRRKAGQPCACPHTHASARQQPEQERPA